MKNNLSKLKKESPDLFAQIYFMDVGEDKHKWNSFVLDIKLLYF